MHRGTIDITGLMLYRDKAKENGKSEDYIMALSDLIETLQESKEKYIEKQKKNLEKLNKRRTNSISSEPVTLYFYERKADGSISKKKYKAIEKKNSYELQDCWRNRLSKNYDINKFTDISHHEMWTDTENDKLMDELLEYYPTEIIRNKEH